jgi:hypothetical protein
VETSYYINVGDFEAYRRMSLADRLTTRKELLRFTKPLRDGGGSVTGHPKTDRRSGF